MNDELTHTVEITITGCYPHGERQHSRITVSGDGQLDHMLTAFKAALVAEGYGTETVEKLRIEV